MLNLKENRDKLIKRAIAATIPLQEDYEYEPSGIIQALFEVDSSEVPGFKDRKNKQAKEARRKIEESRIFFGNSSAYIKNNETKDKSTKDSNGQNN